MKVKTLDKSYTKVLKKRDHLVGFLQKNGEKITDIDDLLAVLKSAKQFFGTNTPMEGELTLPRLHALFNAFLQRTRYSAPKRNQVEEITRFYKSQVWKSVRYQVLQQGNFRCGACGRSVADGIVLNVDHIKPLKKYWQLRLVRENLQVLCADCNQGKGNSE